MCFLRHIFPGNPERESEESEDSVDRHLPHYGRPAQLTAQDKEQAARRLAKKRDALRPIVRVKRNGHEIADPLEFEPETSNLPDDDADYDADSSSPYDSLSDRSDPDSISLEKDVPTSTSLYNPGILDTDEDSEEEEYWQDERNDNEGMRDRGHICKPWLTLPRVYRPRFNKSSSKGYTSDSDTLSCNAPFPSDRT